MKVCRVKLKYIYSALLLGALLLQPVPVHADVAPPEQPPGSNPAPYNGATTQVEMAAETVTITVGGMAVLTNPTFEDEAVEASVNAVFTMRNSGSASESMQVRFPLASPSGMGDGFFNFPEIQDFKVKVDGSSLAWQVQELPNPLNADDPPVRWAVFPVTFPAGKDVIIDVAYGVQSTGYLPEARFWYILETGAGWKGPIGSGEIILELPYEASVENLLLTEYQTQPGYSIEGSRLRWTFTNLEPSSNDNWYASIISPAAWQEILNLRQQVQQSPENGETWRKLGELYENIALIKSYYMVNEGAPGYVLLAEDAYRKALAVNPGDADLHFRLAMVLYAHYLNADYVDGVKPDLSIIVNELNSVLALDPDNEDVAWFYNDVGMWADEPLPPLGGPTFTPAPLFDTPTPIPSSTPLPPATATAPVPTQPVQLQPTPADTPGPQGPLGVSWTVWALLAGGLCLVSIGAALVMALAVLFVKRSK